MIPLYMPKQHIQRQKISDKQLYSYMTDFLDEMRGLQQGQNHLLDTYQLSVRPLIWLKYSGRTLKRTIDSLKTSKQLLQLENNS